MEIEQSCQVIHANVLYNEAVELVTVYRKVAQTSILPHILLIHLDAHQVRHHVSQPVIVVAFDPHHFHLPLGIRELANVAKKPPVLLGKTSEVQVGENVSQKDQSAKTVLPQHSPGFIGTAHVRTKVQVGEDERVVNGRTHHSNLYRANVKA